MIPLKSIQQARQAIHGIVLKTPLVPAFSFTTSKCNVWFKLDSLQPTGAFKLRGATNALKNLDSTAQERGVICASTGNHGRALAYAGKLLGVPVHICMSELVPDNKVKAVKQAGAEVEIIGQSQDEAQQRVEQRVRDEGLTMIPPFDAEDVIAGQGTVALEMLEQRPQLDTLVVPLSGGGLISGVASAAKQVNPEIKVIGASMNRGAAMYESLQAGHPVEVKEYASLADSLGGGIGMQNRWTYAITKNCVDQVVLLKESQIAAAMRHLFFQEQLIQEGAGACGVAVVLEQLANLGAEIGVVLTGRNIDMKMYCEVIAGKLPFGED